MAFSSMYRRASARIDEMLTEFHEKTFAAW
jgi:hypothetical protein